MDSIVQSIIIKYGKELKKKKNYQGFSGTLKPKVTNGKIIKGTKAFIAYVEKKEKLDSLDIEDVIPELLSLSDQMIVTDIIVIERMFALPEVCRTNKRPITAGCSAMNYQGTACTLGAIVKNKKKGEEKFVGVLANNHCAARENKASKGESYIYPSPRDGGHVTSDKIAGHWRHVEIKFNEFTCPYRNSLHRLYRVFVDAPFNRVDASLERLTVPLDEVSYEIWKIGPIKGKRRGEIGELAHKTGRTTGYTSGAKLIDNDYYGSVQYSRGVALFGPCALFEKQGFSDGGDSSSLILWESDDYTGSLLFAGSTTHTIGCHVDLVEEDLEIEIICSIENE